MDETIFEGFDTSLYIGSGEGIEVWLKEMPDLVRKRIALSQAMPISIAEFNQLLTLSHEASVSLGFFCYYWTDDVSDVHPYDIENLPNFEKRNYTNGGIISTGHFLWGLHRLFLDGLLYAGNVRQFFRDMRSKDFEEICDYFNSKSYDTESLIARGAYLNLEEIPKDDRYLIAEIACKTYESDDIEDLKETLVARAVAAFEAGHKKFSFSDLIDGTHLKAEQIDQMSLPLTADNAKFTLSEVVDERVEIADVKDIDEKISQISIKFSDARHRALNNTNLYLSMVPDLDVYVATSMRTRDDFRSMADRCDRIFSDTKLSRYNIRYFDPTMSAAESHEDKGLIECLMVKACKVLVYMAGAKESYGKDSEAAMALSLGKPVIFVCDSETRADARR